MCRAIAKSRSVIRCPASYVVIPNRMRGGQLTDPLPEGLSLRNRADYAVMLVPRDLP